MAYLKRLTALNIASNSRSYALYLRWAEESVFIKKPKGCHALSTRCCKTAPIAKSDASTAMLIGEPVTG